MKKINGIPANPSDKAAEHLSALQRALQTTGVATVYEPSDPPRLVVRNPKPGERPHVIYAATDKQPDGTKEWWFWWRLLDRITKVEDVEEAAQQIAEALEVRKPS